MTNVFVDSNVVIYSIDRSSPIKRERARAWLSSLSASSALTMSVQVPNEVYSVLTLKMGLSPVVARDALTRLAMWVTAPLDFEIVQRGWGLQDRFGLRIWDALLLASANVAGCSYFLSEDLNDGQRYGAVTAINPFRHAPQDVLGAALP